MKRRGVLALSVLFLAGCGAVAEEDTGHLESVGASVSEGAGVLVDPTYLGLTSGSGSGIGGTSENPQAADPLNPGFSIGPATGNSFHRLLLDTADVVPDQSILQVGEHLTDSDIREAVTMTSRFAAEELATSELAFDYTTEGAQQWLDEHAELFLSPDLIRSALLGETDTNDSLALLYTDHGWDRGVPVNASRVQNLQVILTSVTWEQDVLSLTYSVTFEAEVTGAGGLDTRAIEQTRLQPTYRLRQIAGQWKIEDYATRWQTTYRF